MSTATATCATTRCAGEIRPGTSHTPITTATFMAAVAAMATPPAVVATPATAATAAVRVAAHARDLSVGLGRIELQGRTSRTPGDAAPDSYQSHPGDHGACGLHARADSARGPDLEQARCR